MKFASSAWSYGFALGAMIWGVGCAQGGAGGDEGPGSFADSGFNDATVATEDGSAGEDAPSLGEDSPTSGDDTGVVSDDGGPPSDDAPSTSDDGSTSDGAPSDDAGHDAGTVDDDAGHDSGTTVVDAGHDAGTTVDAGTDSGTIVDAGHDSGTTVDAGHDSGPPATVATGGACDDGQTCATGDVCAGGSEADGGGYLCYQTCTGTSSCTAPAVPSGTTSEPKNGPYCVDTITGPPVQKICSVPCNPVTNAGASGCPDGLACGYAASTTSSPAEYTDCEPAGSVLAGGTCTEATLATSCDFGLVCIVSGTSSSGTCRYVCRAGVNADCPTGDTCKTFTGITSPMFGYCNP